MKYNTTYTKSLSMKDILIEISKIKKNIHQHVIDNFNLLEVTAPMFISGDSQLLIRMDNVTRHVSYDQGDDLSVVKQIISHTNWLRNLALRLKLKDNEGLLTTSSLTWRDLPQNPASSTQREVMTFQIKLSKDEDLKVRVNEISKQVYSWIYKEAQRLKKEKGLANRYPKIMNFATSQMLENELNHLNYRDREIEMAKEKNGFFLDSSGKKLFSGNVHSFIPSYLYDFNRFRQILLLDKVNTSILKVASIGVLASGQVLYDQLAMNNMLELKEFRFYKDLVNQKHKVIEVQINLTKLMIALLQIGHIGEVQPGVYSSETKVIAEKYKIDII